MRLSSIFDLYRGGQFNWWREPEYPDKTTDLPKVTDKLHHIMIYELLLGMSAIRTPNVVSSTPRYNVNDDIH